MVNKVLLNTKPAALPRTGSGAAAEKSSLPLEVTLSQNPVLGRIAVELLGYTPWAVAFARTTFERWEKLMDTVSWLIIGVGVPLILEKVFNGHYSRHLKNNFEFVHQKPLAIPFKMLDRAELASERGKENLQKALGLYPKTKLPQLANKILLGKLFLMATDLFFTAAKGQVYYYCRNLATKYFSGKEGFSGEFDQAGDEYVKLQAKDFSKNQKLKQILSTLVGFGGNLGFPIILYFLLHTRHAPGQGVLGKLKKLTPAIEYHDAVYMSKWVLLWHCICNWNIGGLFYARDKHELREHLVRCLVFDTFYFAGDDIFSSLAARHFERKYAHELAGIKLTEKSPLGFSVAKPFHEIYQEAQLHGNSAAQKVASNFARWNFRIGLTSTAACLGIFTTLLNNAATANKVKKEEKELIQKGIIQGKGVAKMPLIQPLQAKLAYEFS